MSMLMIDEPSDTHSPPHSHDRYAFLTQKGMTYLIGAY